MICILDISEAYIEFLLLLITIVIAYRPKEKKLILFLKLFFTELFFGFFYTFTNNYISSIYSFVLACATPAIVFAWIILPKKEQLAGMLSMIFTYIFTIVCAKSAFLMISGFENFTYDNHVWQSICRFAAYYFILILCTIFYSLHPLIYEDNLPFRYWVLVIAAPAITAGSMFINTGMTLEPETGLNIASSGNKKIAFLMFLTILVVYYLNYTILHIFQQLLVSYRINQQMQSDIMSLQANSNMIEQVRKEKHELKNNYFYILSLVKEHKYDKLENFLDTELSYHINNLDEYHTGHQMLDILLTQKLGEAKNLGIRTMTNITLPREVDFEQNDLCSLILNLLNNAIEGSSGITDADIQISMSVVKNYLKIQIKNRSLLAYIPSDGNIPTSKKNTDYHGLGIKIVKKIVAKYDGTINFSIQAEYFTVDCMLKIQKDK